MENGPHCPAVISSALTMSRVSDARRTDDIAAVALLIQRTLRGEAAAFEQLIARYERRVFSLAIKLLGTPDDAEDAAQEVFLRVFKYIHRFDVDKPIEPWLMQMTVNVCRNIGRNRLRRWNTFPAIADDDIAVAPDSSDPHSGFSEEQEKQMLWKALDTLPEKERLAVILRDIDGMKTSEVAEVLGSSETTVRSQVSRARVRMKEVIDRMTGGRS